MTLVPIQTPEGHHFSLTLNVTVSHEHSTFFTEMSTWNYTD